MKLKRLYGKIQDLEYVKYVVGEPYPAEISGEITYLDSLEVLEIGRQDPIQECVRLASFRDAPSRVIYFGEDAEEMVKTLESLKMPKSPSNLGEMIFNTFKFHLKKFGIGPASIEQKIYAPEEHQFLTVFRKLVHVYSDREIDSSFYAA